MKKFTKYWVMGLFIIGSHASAQTYTNYLRQFQMPSGVSWDASSTVAASGTQLSSLSINPGGARFDLWTILSSTPVKEYLLATRYVSSYVPIADVVIRTEDPYAVIRRTRADRPFWVDITTSGLLSGATDPEPSKSVTLLRHVQSYGAAGTAVGLNRDNATLFSQSSINTNGMQTLTISLVRVPGSPLTKLCGEERFSVFSLEDYQAPASTLDSQFVQIWPVADGSISGINNGDLIRFSMPSLTVATNDLYPGSTCYLQYYKGSPALGTVGDRLAWSNNKTSATEASPPESSTFGGLDRFFDSDGVWTIELMTGTPFGTDRLAFISFTIDRTIEVIGTVTTIE
jgi:hypothetical protein